MIVRRVRLLLLEAAPAELHGEGESEIARLVREDPAVRTAATRILEELVAVDVGLATAARVGASHITAPGDRAPLAARPLTPGNAGFDWRFALGLAGSVGAVITALMLWPPPIPPVQPSSPESPSITATLDAAAPRLFGVFATDNPDIAIVWLFDREVP